MPMGARWADMRAAALAAEAAGFDGLWTWDHLRDPDDDGTGPGVPEAWTVLTALAEVTRRVMLGPLVLNVANRHPGVLANMAATLQTVSGGRLLLGLGAGGSRRTPYAVEQAAIGQARRARRSSRPARGRRHRADPHALGGRGGVPPAGAAAADRRGRLRPPHGRDRRPPRRRLQHAGLASAARRSPARRAGRARQVRARGVGLRGRRSSRGWRIAGCAPTRARARWSSGPASTG